MGTQGTREVCVLSQIKYVNITSEKPCGSSKFCWEDPM